MAVVVCIPGAADSERTFRDLTPLWPPRFSPVFHNLRLASDGAISGGYSWQSELDHLAEHLAQVAAKTVYLLGISAGATLVLAYIADNPTVAGIGLLEPAWSYLPQTEIEALYYTHLDQVLVLPANKQREAFVRLLLQPDVNPPPVTRTAALGYQRAERPHDTALAIGTRAMQAHRVEPTKIMAFRGTVYLAIGGLSNPMWHAQAAQIRAALPWTEVEIYPERHHLDLPHHAEAVRLRNAIVRAWSAGYARAGSA